MARKRNMEEARRTQDAKRKREERLGNAIVEWEEHVERCETALDPFLHPMGKPRSQDQIVMAMQTSLYFMRQFRLDAEEDDQIEHLRLDTVDRATAAVHGMSYNLSLIHI